MDIYVRNSETPEVEVLVKTVVSGQVVLSAPDTPVLKIYVMTDSSGQILDDPSIQVIYTTDGDAAHRMYEDFNARFSQYEVVVISGLDTYEGQDIHIRVAKTPHISELQSFVDSSENRVVASVVRVQRVKTFSRLRLMAWMAERVARWLTV